MSYSHASVGHALIQGKDREGSRMSASQLYTPKLLADNQFDLLAHGISYRTTVCKYVVNRNTRQHELWVSPIYYSQSTQRHLGYFRAGFLAKHASDNIFVTPAANSPGSYISRTDKTFAQQAMLSAETILAEVDKPRLREATRRGALASALTRLDVAYRNMAKGTKLDTVDADTLYDLQGTIHFIEMLQATDDIDEVRAAVRAHQTLNNPKNI